MLRRLVCGLVLLTCLLLAQSGPVGTAERLSPSSPGVRRVNAPYNVPGEEAAIFWFGRVAPTENYADVRVSYKDNRIHVHLAIMDRLLWFDRSPSHNLDKPEPNRF